MGATQFPANQNDPNQKPASPNTDADQEDQQPQQTQDDEDPSKKMGDDPAPEKKSRLPG